MKAEILTTHLRTISFTGVPAMQPRIGDDGYLLPNLLHTVNVRLRAWDPPVHESLTLSAVAMDSIIIPHIAFAVNRHGYFEATCKRAMELIDMGEHKEAKEWLASMLNSVANTRPKFPSPAKK